MVVDVVPVAVVVVVLADSVVVVGAVVVLVVSVVVVDAFVVVVVVVVADVVVVVVVLVLAVVVVGAVVVLVVSVVVVDAVVVVVVVVVADVVVVVVVLVLVVVVVGTQVPAPSQVPPEHDVPAPTNWHVAVQHDAGVPFATSSSHCWDPPPSPSPQLARTVVSADVEAECATASVMCAWLWRRVPSASPDATVPAIVIVPDCPGVSVPIVHVSVVLESGDGTALTNITFGSYASVIFTPVSVRLPLFW